MSDEWNEDFEPGGITMGPEDRLEREIAKSKALKVERLQLRDTVSRLKEEVETLGRENTELARKLSEQPTHPSDHHTQTAQATGESGSEPRQGNCWTLGAIAIALIASAVLGARWYFG